jgi:large subunit ribosomal protein L35
MPKMKSHRGAAKRFSRTGSGKIKFKHANMRHNFGAMSKVQKKRLIQTGILKPVDAKIVDRVLNGG